MRATNTYRIARHRRQVTVVAQHNRLKWPVYHLGAFLKNDKCLKHKNMLCEEPALNVPTKNILTKSKPFENAVSTFWKEEPMSKAAREGNVNRLLSLHVLAGSWSLKPTDLIDLANNIENGRGHIRNSNQ